MIIPQWHNQSLIAFILPHKKTHWQECLQEILESYYKLILLISKHQRVLVITQDIKLSKPLQNKHNISIKQAPYNDTWARDTLPISIKRNNKIQLLNFTFNGWGNKYTSNLDNTLSSHIFKNTKNINICLEGGAMDNNGKDLILLNKQTLTKSRNIYPPTTIINKLQKIFKAKILLLKNGSLKGDDTDSHTDTLARFVNKNTIVYLSPKDKSDPNYQPLSKMQQELKQIAKKHNLTLSPIKSPSQKTYHNRPLPATYINFIITNKTVIVPTYNDINDKQAINKIKKHFPKKDIIGFDASIFIRQNGSLHCASMNFFS